MGKYVLAYYYDDRKPQTPDRGGRAKFGAWLGTLGDAVINPGTPLGPSKTVSAGSVTDNAGPARLTGFSIVKADSLDAAIAMAKTCPFLEMGTIEVAEAMEMK